MKRFASIFLTALVLGLLAGACNRELCPAYSSNSETNSTVEVTG